MTEEAKKSKNKIFKAIARKDNKQKPPETPETI